MSTETHARTFLLLAVGGTLTGPTLVAACALVAAALFHAYTIYTEWQVRRWVADIARAARESAEAGARTSDTSGLFNDAIEEARALDARWNDMEDRIQDLEESNA